MKILIAPHTSLLQPALPVKKIDKRIKNIAAEMSKTLLAHRDPIGVGLSGNQVSVLERIFVTRPNEKTQDITIFVNPRIIDTDEGSAKRKPTLEGCLSIPEIWGHVLRPEKVKVEYFDLHEEKHADWFEDFEAIVIQHELDHLEGILFTQRVLEQGRELYKEVDGELEPWRL